MAKIQCWNLLRILYSHMTRKKRVLYIVGYYSPILSHICRLFFYFYMGRVEYVISGTASPGEKGLKTKLEQSLSIFGLYARSRNFT